MSDPLTSFESDAGTESLEGESSDGYDGDDPYCPAANPGPGPHEYAPVIDILAGTGIWLFCRQCGDTFNVDGTAVQPQAGSPQTGAPAPTAPPPAGAPSGQPWP